MTRIFAVLIAASLLSAQAASAADPAQNKTRTLDAITIEGAVDVPQVLFITSRENARFDDGLSWFFLPEPDDVLTGAALPTVIRPCVFTQDFQATENKVPVPPESPAAKE